MTETMVVFRSLISLKCKIITIHSTMSSHQHNTSIQNHTQNEAIRSAIPGAHKTKLIIERVARAQTVCVCARARSRWPPQPHRRGGAFIQVWLIEIAAWGDIMTYLGAEMCGGAQWFGTKLYIVWPPNRKWRTWGGTTTADDMVAPKIGCVFIFVVWRCRKWF